MKVLFVICVILILSFLFGYLGVTGYLSQFYSVFTLLPTFLSPFVLIYNIMTTYNNTMLFVMVFIGSYIIRYVLGKLGVYDD